MKDDYVDGVCMTYGGDIKIIQVVNHEGKNQVGEHV
jgi:hypothetical protein